MAQLKPLSEEEVETVLDNAQIDQVAAKELVQQMTRYLEAYTLDIRKGYEVDSEDMKSQIVVLSNEEDTLKVVYSNTNGVEDVRGSVVVEKDGVKLLKGYEIFGGQVEQTLEVEVTPEILEQIDNSDEVDIPDFSGEPDEVYEEVTEQLKCMHGNWCGPLCSGPKAPVDGVDSCCRTHDRCYGIRGYFACSCDKGLHKCLNKYVVRGNKWAIIVSSWFYAQRCNPFK